MAAPAVVDLSTAEAEPVAAASTSGRTLVIVGALAGLLAGAGAGAVLVGPRLAPVRRGPETVTRPVAPAPPIVHSIENLVVNPAQTAGARFLMVTCAIEVKDDAALAEVKAREAEIRDRVVDLLSAKTVDELTSAAGREALKAQLATAVSALFPAGMITRVLLPQFVIQ